MSETIRVLIVEDLPSDAELTEREIRKALGRCEFHRVETREAFLAALAGFCPGLIVSDYKLPSFDGLSALKLALERCPDVPFIILTGSMNEDTAVECMKAGAWDYVIKEHIKRLGAAVLNALDQKRMRRERHLAAAALRESEERLKEAQRLGRIGHWEFDPETQQIRWSDAVFAIYGRDPKLGPPTVAEEAAYYSAEDAERLRDGAQKALETGEPYELDVSVRRPGERSVEVVSKGAPITDSAGRIVRLRGTVQDITARKREQERDRLTRDVLESLNRQGAAADPILDILRLIKKNTSIEAVGIRLREGDDFPYYETNGFPDHFVRLERSLCTRDATGAIVRDRQGNPVLECMCGNVLCGRTDPAQPFFTEGGSFWTNGTTQLLASTTAADRQARTRNRCNGEGYESVALIPLRSGEEIIGLLQLNDHQRDQFTLEMIRFLEGLGASIGIALGRRRAEAERGKLEEQLRVSQKMEAIGSLAGGVAHDFNNLLSVILSYTGFAIKGLPEGDPVRADLQEVKMAGERAVTLTRQLLAFSRKQMLQPVALDLNQIAAGVEKMLRRILGEDIDLVKVLAADLGLTMADPGQIEQVIMNLVVNARDAMPEGGKLTIETANVEIDAEYAARHVAVTPGSYVRLTVTDTGRGMDQQTQARLFEPFFTTKEKGRGTGLGLSTVYGIVKQSGGNIWVYSELGQGTTFKIYLPRALTATAPAPLKPPAVPHRTTGTETLLVVEDEEALRRVAKRALEAAGYTVLSAADGAEALQACARHAGEIQLLLTDVVMPGMGGRVLAQALAKTRPTLKVLYMSGYTDDAIVHHGVLDAGTHFLAKPFCAADLQQKVREVLDEGRQGPAADQEPAEGGTP